MNERTVGTELGRLVDAFFESRRREFQAAAAECRTALAGGRKILACGNGGSAAEAQHFVAELVNKFLKPRQALRAVTLSADTSILTSIGNDVSFDAVFSRQVEALGDPGDVLLALSTSGQSPNILEAVRTARRLGLKTVALTGRGGGRLAGEADILLDVPSAETPRVQEVHLVILHLLAETFEGGLSS